MTALGTGVFTLGDMAKLLNPDGSTAQMAKLLSQKNSIANDIPFMEGNLPTGHQIVVETALPGVAFRQLNDGVVPTTGSSAQLTEQVAILEAYSQVDERLVRMAKDPGAFRVMRADRYFESMLQTMASTIINGNSNVNPEQFTGLAARYSTTSTSVATSQNVIHAGGTAAAGSVMTSIYAVNWGPGRVYGIYGQGAEGGLRHEDLGLETVTMTAGQPGKLMRAYRDHFVWEAGIAVEDWRNVVRICNINSTALSAQTATPGNAELNQKLFQALNRIPDPENGNTVIYMNRTCAEFLGIQSRAVMGGGWYPGGATTTYVPGGGINPTTVQIQRVRDWNGYPVRIVDQITNTEALVV